MTNTTFAMAVNATATPAYDSLTVGGTLTVQAAALVVNNAGSLAFPAYTTNVLQFFPSAVAVNISNIVAGGITNISLPVLPAGEFWITNLAVNGSMAVANTNSALNVNPPNVQVSVGSAGGNQTLTLGWPNNLGWILQAQTNNSNTGLTPSSNWVDVPGSALITNTVITVDPTQPAVFYRMRNPNAPVE